MKTKVTWQSAGVTFWFVLALLAGFLNRGRGGDWAEKIGYTAGMCLIPLALAFALRYCNPKSGWGIAVGVIAWLGVFSMPQHFRPPATVHDVMQEVNGTTPVPPNESEEDKKARLALTELVDLRRQQANARQKFEQTLIGKNMLAPETMASTQVAADSLRDLEQYIDTSATIRDGTLALDARLHSDDTAARTYYDAEFAYFHAAQAVYRYAAQPSERVSLNGGKVRLVNPDGYNALVKEVNSTAVKFNQASETYHKLRDTKLQSLGLSVEDFDKK
jgi:hypothetical protein